MENNYRRFNIKTNTQRRVNLSPVPLEAESSSSTTTKQKRWIELTPVPLEGGSRYCRDCQQIFCFCEKSIVGHYYLAIKPDYKVCKVFSFSYTIC